MNSTETSSPASGTFAAHVREFAAEIDSLTDVVGHTLPPLRMRDDAPAACDATRVDRLVNGGLHGVLATVGAAAGFVGTALAAPYSTTQILVVVAAVLTLAASAALTVHGWRHEDRRHVNTTALGERLLHDYRAVLDQLDQAGRHRELLYALRAQEPTLQDALRELNRSRHSLVKRDGDLRPDRTAADAARYRDAYEAARTLVAEAQAAARVALATDAAREAVAVAEAARGFELPPARTQVLAEVANLESDLVELAEVGARMGLAPLR